MRTYYISWMLAFLLSLWSVVTYSYAATWGSPENLNELIRTSEKSNQFDISAPHVLDDFKVFKILRPLVVDPTELKSKLQANGCGDTDLRWIENNTLVEVERRASCFFSMRNLVSIHNELWKVYVQNGRKPEEYCHSLRSFRKSLSEIYLKHLNRLTFAYDEPIELEDDRKWISTSDAYETAKIINKKIPSIPLFEAMYLTSFFKSYAAMAILTDRVEINCNSPLILDQNTHFDPGELQAFIDNMIAAGVRDFSITDQFIELDLSHVAIDKLDISNSFILALRIRKSNIGSLKIENSIVAPVSDSEILLDQNGQNKKEI